MMTLEREGNGKTTATPRVMSTGRQYLDESALTRSEDGPISDMGQRQRGSKALWGFVTHRGFQPVGQDAGSDGGC